MQEGWAESHRHDRLWSGSESPGARKRGRRPRPGAGDRGRHARDAHPNRGAAISRRGVWRPLPGLSCMGRPAFQGLTPLGDITSPSAARDERASRPAGAAGAMRWSPGDWSFCRNNETASDKQAPTAVARLPPVGVRSLGAPVRRSDIGSRLARPPPISRNRRRSGRPTTEAAAARRFAVPPRRTGPAYCRGERRTRVWRRSGHNGFPASPR